MDYKEKILAELGKWTEYQLQEDGVNARKVIEFGRVKNLINSLPSEKEIAKGWWKKFEKDKELFEAGKLPYFEFSFVRWLDNREIEHG